MTKRPKISDPSALDLLVPARTTRERMEQDGSDFAPMVLYVPKRGISYTAVLGGDGTLEDQLAVVLADMRTQLGPAQWIAVTTDAYVTRAPVPDAHERGDLAKAFEAGDPTITEQMVVVLQRRNQVPEMASQTYRYTPVDGFEWDEPEVTTDYRAGVSFILNYYV